MSKRRDRIPALDPSRPAIYRQIIETADALRKLQRLDIEVRYSATRVLNKIRMRAAVGQFYNPPTIGPSEYIRARSARV